VTDLSIICFGSAEDSEPARFRVEFLRGRDVEPWARILPETSTTARSVTAATIAIIVTASFPARAANSD
jgi:hypothetical protein